MQYLNKYEHCEQEWQDTWSCACNDKCPMCNKEIEPYDSEIVPFTTEDSERLLGLADQFLEDWREAFDSGASDDERIIDREIEWQAIRPLLVEAPNLLAALEGLRKELRNHVKMDVKKHFSLLVADAAAGKAIAKVKGAVPS